MQPLLSVRRTTERRRKEWKSPRSEDAGSNMFRAGQTSVFKIYRVQNLPAKNVPFRVDERHIRHIFIALKMCREHRVNVVSVKKDIHFFVFCI